VEGQLDAAVGLRPDVAVVTVGGNDAIRLEPVRRYAAALENIISRLEQVSGAVVLAGVGDLGTIPRLPSSLRSYLSRRSRAFDRACLRVSVSHPRTVKAPAGRQTSKAFRTDLALFAPDQFHASAAGHALFAETMAPALAAAYRIARSQGRGAAD